MNIDIVEISRIILPSIGIAGRSYSEATFWVGENGERALAKNFVSLVLTPLVDRCVHFG